MWGHKAHDFWWSSWNVWLCPQTEIEAKTSLGLGYAETFQISTTNEKGSFHCESSEVSFPGPHWRWGNDDWIFFQRKLTLLLWESSDVHLVFERFPRYEERGSAKSYWALNHFTTTNRDQKNDHLFIILRIILFHCVHEMWSFVCLEEMSALNI